MLFIYLAVGIILFGMTAPLLAAAQRYGMVIGLGCLAASALISAVAAAFLGAWGVLPFAAVAGVLLVRQLRDAVHLYPEAPRQRISTPAA